MQLRACLRGISGLEAPPFASLTLMVLLCCLGLMDSCETLALKSDQLLQHFQVHRLLTYPLCSLKPSLLFLDLLLFLLLGWWQEQCLGTLRYLYHALLSTIASALLYLLLIWLWTLPPSNACGYTTVHLAMLTAPRGQPPALRWGLLRRIRAPALPWLLLFFIYLSFSESPFLLYLSGVVSGLAYSAGILSWLHVSEEQVEKLEKHTICRTLSELPFVHFIPSPRRGGILPVVDPRARSVEILDSQAQTPLQGSVPTSPLSNVYSASPDWPPGASLADLVDPVMDEVFLRAGIEASLEEFSPAESSELKLSRSAVSSLRLQQLEKMGFPTDQAVVALAATGKVEGAVSLLVEGQVGDEILVTTEGRPRHITCDAQGQGHLSAECAISCIVQSSAET
ncbi:rhomboid domain-containing protein 3 [Microcaecilia unicolor]|uniref:Rhomboid domain-containing protein 3 n=1 Tax=Microcaecilia unicolor TaxID=1415580 RepID=A0A6P7ZEP5_9AMPH|nr:rhomboid domain-containing protein 3 [Microcaecilia unicolor]